MFDQSMHPMNFMRHSSNQLLLMLINNKISYWKYFSVVIIPIQNRLLLKLLTKIEIGLLNWIIIIRKYSRLFILFLFSSFEYEVFVTADNSIFTCYSFLWKSESEYQIVVQPGQIMKGSRIKSDESNSSGKTIDFIFFYLQNLIQINR